MLHEHANELTQTNSADIPNGGGGSASVRVASARSTAVTGSLNLNSNMEEALKELVEFLVAKPDRILLTLRMAKNANYYKGESTLSVKSTDYIHMTLVYFSGVPKVFWKEVLMEYFSQHKDKNQGVTMELLAAVDKAGKLHGLVRYAPFLAKVLPTDHLPAALHYKPLLKKELLARMTTARELKIEKDGQVDFAAGGEYSLADLEDGVYTAILHKASGGKVAMPEDFVVKESANWKITDNRDWLGAKLVGARVNDSIYDIFNEKDMHCHIDYDTDAFLEANIAQAKQDMVIPAMTAEEKVVVGLPEDSCQRVRLLLSVSVECQL
jgi:hypothetical protein